MGNFARVNGIVMLASALFVSVPWGADAATVAYWRFEGDYTDASGNGHDASGPSAPAISAEVFGPTVPATGAANTASAQFVRASQNYLSVADHPTLDLTGDFTIEAWVKHGSLGSRQFVTIKKDFGQADTKLNYAFMSSIGNYAMTYGKTAGLTGHEMGLLLGNGSGYVAIGSSFAITDNDWHAISVAFDAAGGEVRFTYDGQTETITGVAFTPAANNHALQIGVHPGTIGSDYFGGHIDELRISNTVVPGGELLNPLVVPEPAGAVVLAGLTLAAVRRRR